MVDAFEALTNRLVPVVDDLLKTTTLLEFSTKINAAKPQIDEWRARGQLLDDGSERVESLKTLLNTKLRAALEHKRSFQGSSAPAAGKRRKSTRRRRARSTRRVKRGRVST